MPVVQHTLRRGGIYHLRCRVPSDLVSVVGHRELHRTLATACPREAKRRAYRLYGRMLDLFEGLRTMAESRDERLAELLALSVEEKDKALVDLATLLETSNDVLEQERAARASAEEVSREAVNQCGILLGKLAETVSQENLDQTLHMRDAARDLQQRHDELKGSALVGQGEALIAQLAKRLGQPVQSATTPTVMAFLDGRYKTERRLADDSQRHIINFITLFARITGNKRLADYNRGDVVDYIRTLERLSNSTGKSPEDKTASIENLLAKSVGKPTLGATTIGKHVQHVKSLFISARKHLKHTTIEAINDLFDDIDLSDFVPLAEKRKSWPIDKLNALFATPIWQGTSSGGDDFTKRHKKGEHIHRDAYWWLPVASLWTGARLEELAQLHHEDLLQDKDGIPFLHIHDEGIRRVKTENSIRSIPVHSVLVGFGFLDLFDPAKAGTRIWPELKPSGRMMKFGDTYSSHFTDYRRHCGLYVRLMDFHSLRRTFITTMRTRANVDALTVAAMAGHDEELPEFQRAKQTNDYTDYALGPLHREIERLDYAGYGLNLDLIWTTQRAEIAATVPPAPAAVKEPRRRGRATGATNPKPR